MTAQSMDRPDRAGIGTCLPAHAVRRRPLRICCASDQPAASSGKRPEPIGMHAICSPSKK